MLDAVNLTSFKSFDDVRIELGRLTLIVGANASGKSNIRDALRFLHGVGLGYPLAEIIGEKYGPGGVLTWRGIRGGMSEIASHGYAEFTVGCDLCVEPGRSPTGGIRTPGVLQYQITVDVEDSSRGPRVAIEYLAREDFHDYFFDSDPLDDPVEQLAEHRIRVRHAPGGRHRRRGTVLDFSSRQPVLSQLREIACRTTLEQLRSMRFLDLDPEAMREPSLPGQVILGDRGENLSSVLQAICADDELKQTLLSWVRALTPMDAANFEFVPDFRGRVLVYLVEANGSRVSALSASDGTLRFLALIAALLSPDSGTLYFFEEFDNGIHPTRLHLLLQLVQQACERQGIQVIGTTHNPAMLAFLDEDAREHALLVYRPDGSRYSKVRRVMELPDIARVIRTQDLGRLHAAGWLEDAAEFSEPEPEDEVDA